MPTSSYFDPEGSVAGSNSLVYHHEFIANLPVARIIGILATAPFGSLLMLDPALQRVGFGYTTIDEPANARRPSSVFNTTAVLDVYRGRGVSSPLSPPAMFPQPGATIPATCETDACKGSDFPPTSSHCNYRGPNPFTAPRLGIPIWLQFGEGTAPVVSAAALTADNIAIPVCTITEQTYTTGTPDWEDLGRRLLRERGAVVLLPRTPLAAGKTYTVSVTVNGTAYMWSFEVR